MYILCFSLVYTCNASANITMFQVYSKLIVYLLQFTPTRVRHASVISTRATREYGRGTVDLYHSQFARVTFFLASDQSQWFRCSQLFWLVLRATKCTSSLARCTRVRWRLLRKRKKKPNINVSIKPEGQQKHTYLAETNYCLLLYVVVPAK